MWADKFECDFADLFDSQDRLANSVLGAVLPQLERAEIDRSRGKPPDSLQAYDQYLWSKHSTYLWTRAGNVDALKFARLAISLDSEFPAVHAHAANLFGQRKAFGWVDDIEAERAESRSLIERALLLDQDDPLVLAHAAQVYSYTLEEPESGLAYAIKATRQDPNLVMARLWAGWAKVYLGDHEASIEEFLVAIRLSPIDPHLFLPLTGMAYAHFFCGRYEESLSWAARAVQRQPNFPGARRIQMSSLALTGAQADAQSVRAALVCIDRDLRVSNITRTPFRRPYDI